MIVSTSGFRNEGVILIAACLVGRQDGHPAEKRPMKSTPEEKRPRLDVGDRPRRTRPQIHRPPHVPHTSEVRILSPVWIISVWWVKIWRGADRAIS